MAEFTTTSSAPATPSIINGTSDPFFGINNVNNASDNNAWNIGQGSPGSKRCPTFKDYAEKIKELQQENFQLRVRVFLSEQKTGVKSSSSDFAVLFQQNMQQLQNALNANNSSASHSTAASSSSTEIFSAQVTNLKSQNEHLNEKLGDLEQKLRNYESALKEKQSEIQRLQERNEMLQEKMEDLQTEFSVTRIKLQQASEKQYKSINDEEVERGALIAFGHYEDELDSCKQELNAKLKEESDKVRQLEKKLIKQTKDYDKLHQAYAKSEAKVCECSKALMEFGKRNIELTNELENLKIAQQVQQRDLNQSKAMDSAMQDRYGAVREVVGLLQRRIFEIIAFIEALFNLETIKVFNIAGLSGEHRESLRLSVEQCRNLSSNLDELFHMADNSILTNRKLRLVGISLNESLTYNSHNYSPERERRAAGDVSPPQSKAVESKASQCTFEIDPRRTSAGDDRLAAKLKRKLEKSEAQRNKLQTDQYNLQHRIHSLTTEVEKCYQQIESLQAPNDVMSSHSIHALEVENTALTERLTISDSALRRLHQEHAKLVSQLKEMKSLQVPGSPNKMPSFLESERPSETTSPDLGIDSGHDGAVNSDDSQSNVYKSENRVLRNANKELALKLRHAKQILQTTVDKLNCTTKQKEQMEKAVCRQLHKTHTILRQAKQSVEHFTVNQCQENIIPVPSSSTCKPRDD